MKFITIRDFRSKSAKIQKELPEEREMVLTSNGKPVAILTAVSEGDLEESLALIRKARALAAVISMQESAREVGADRMSLNEINKEIAAARKERRKK